MTLAVLVLSSSAVAQTAPSSATAGGGNPPYTAADVQFMRGMIVHHEQAVLIAGWAPSHSAGASLRVLCERIVVAQQDEIALMGAWLRERHEDVPSAEPHDHSMPGMSHPMLMPGMLTPAQLAQLDSARDLEFDRLFLTFMIQHHQGAIAMVEQLLRVPGAAQDGRVFRFAADVNVDQATEIDRMRRMLAAMPPGETRP
jgi:uncharacterized protein (DUF305 family)